MLLRSTSSCASSAPFGSLAFGAPLAYLAVGARSASRSAAAARFADATFSAAPESIAYAAFAIVQKKIASVRAMTLQRSTLSDFPLAPIFLPRFFPFVRPGKITGFEIPPQEQTRTCLRKFSTALVICGEFRTGFNGPESTTTTM